MDGSSVSSGMVTDLYELRMADSYLRRGMTGQATFSLFSRRLPPERGFLVAAGLDDALTRLEQFAYGEDDLQWLAGQGLGPALLDWLRTFRFSGDVWAVPEGRVVFPDEPLLEVTAPLPEAQLVESVLLNQVTYQTTLATKAARCRLAAGGRAELVDFSLRRTHGVEAAMAAARAAAIAGFTGTSNVAAARKLGIEPIGTMAHSYIETFNDERQAFQAFAEDFPDHTTYLVDTYDTLTGVGLALDVTGPPEPGRRFGIRLDSGDLLGLSLAARQLLDRAGYTDAVIVASGGLDEHEVERLLDAGAPIDVFGVGTRVGVSADAPSLDSAYKLVEYDGRPVMKLSSGKETRPGPKQVYRTDTGAPDLLATRTEPRPPAGQPLLQPAMVGGRRTGGGNGWAAARERLIADLVALPAACRRLDGPVAQPVQVSEALGRLTDEVRRRIESERGPLSRR